MIQQRMCVQVPGQVGHYLVGGGGGWADGVCCVGAQHRVAENAFYQVEFLLHSFVVVRKATVVQRCQMVRLVMVCECRRPPTSG